MNFFKDKELALRFKNDEVPSKERFIYFFIYILMCGIFSMTERSGLKFEGFSSICLSTFSILWLLASIISLFICYKTNKAGDDKEFIERYVCLGFPIFIQIFLWFIPLAIVGIFLSKANLFNEHTLLVIYYSFFLIYSSYFFIYRLNAAFKIASQ